MNAHPVQLLAQVLELAGEMAQLARIRNAVYEHWREKNAAKSKSHQPRNGH